MSETTAPRRRPPSPLVFSPETVLASTSIAQTRNNAQKYGSGSNTVSMPFIKRHVTRRLKAAKQECDKEMLRVTNAITLFFEERLREIDQEREKELRNAAQDTDDELPQEVLGFQPHELKPTIQDDTSSDGGYDAENEGRLSRQPSFTLSTSPAAVQRAVTTTRRERARSQLPPPESISTSDSHLRKSSNASNLQASWGGGVASRRLSRSIHVPIRPSRSTHSSRSTSRSRSPLPRASHSFAEAGVGNSPNRRSSRILVDDPVDPIMTALYALIAVATDITDMTIAQLTAQPNSCTQLVGRVQDIGKTWEDHPDWHGRHWYVQVLLAVASLSRVVEWWLAEKQFWNFEEDDDEQAEPFTFLLKPAEEVAPTPTVFTRKETDDGKQQLLPGDMDARLRLSRPTSQGKRSREEHRKDSSTSLLPREPEAQHVSSRILDTAESARVLATERLRLQAEKAQNMTIVFELGLDGDHLLWVNYAWTVVVGSEPQDVVGSKLSSFLAPSDWNVFKDANERLLADDSHTIEVHFRLQVEPDNEWSAQTTLYRQMEGQGMLVIDHVDGQRSHTMWVIKPIGLPEPDQVQTAVPAEEGCDSQYTEFADRTEQEPVTPFPLNRPISTASVLCRICECNIPEWYFEKHNETCNEVHKFEAAIGENNDSIAELRNTIRDLRATLDRSSPGPGAEYRGMQIFSPVSSPSSSSPLQMFRPPLVSRMQRLGLRRNQKRLLDQLDDILQLAVEISIPSLKEEESKEPIERQRLLSPASERKITQVRNWKKPGTEDLGLARLVSDVEMMLRAKLENISRMQNTIRYSEKVRQEWEEKVELVLATVDENEDDEDDGEQAEDADDADGDHDSTRSEYNYAEDNIPTVSTPSTTSDPTPMAPASVSRSTSFRGIEPLTSSVLSPIPSAYQVPLTRSYTRSSTPSSVSSPLARATPIVANSDPEPMNLLENAGEVIQKSKTAITNQELKLHVTPPISPAIQAKDIPGQRGLRRLSTIISPTSSGGGPISPRIPSVAPSSRTAPTTIKDFEIIKPISKGAFGSVFLAKKRVTGDYYAIKVLKKADMIAKNQITNVKAERMILMTQAESPFVAKLYFTFQSKDNLYLVMEYLNGGDCAALIKTLGALPEEWTKNYIAEVVLGLEYLHQRGVVHRDLKPDNLLIDQHGHLKLTDFGLSRIGLLGRQTRDTHLAVERLRPLSRHSPGSRPPSIDSVYMSSPMINDVPSGGSYFSHRASSVSQIATSPHLSSGPPTDDVSESSGSDSHSGLFFRRGNKPGESPLQSFATELTNDLRSYSTSGAGTPPAEQKFVGTPDYLAPESILGIAGDDASVDWWALGVITYEFLYGFPPFHADTPEKVFENILSGHIEWHEDWVDFSPEARNFMERLMCTDPTSRLGNKGAGEVKSHPFFTGIEWDKVTSTEAAFIPQVTDPESTDYFDLRGATPQLFHDDDAITLGQSAASPSPEPMTLSSAAPVPTSDKDKVSTPGSDDFGSFSFKNLPVLKQANDDMIRRLRTDHMTPMVHALTEPSNLSNPHRRSLSQKIKKPPNLVMTVDHKPSTTNPPSPATSTSSMASSPSRASQAAPSTPGSSTSHMRKPSEFGALERFKSNHLDFDGVRRNSMPSRLRTASVSSSGDQGSFSDHWPSSGGVTGITQEGSTPPSSTGSPDLRKLSDPSDRAVTCLLAEDNPITAKIIETLLTRLGCRCVVVADGSEAISVAMSDIKFDCILMDLHMPVVDGESAARYIKSTANKNAAVPIISVSAYGGQDTSSNNNLFAASLAKPVQKVDLLTVMRQLGFKTSTQHDGRPMKVLAS